MCRHWIQPARTASPAEEQELFGLYLAGLVESMGIWITAGKQFQAKSDGMEFLIHFMHSKYKHEEERRWKTKQQ